MSLLNIVVRAAVINNTISLYNNKLLCTGKPTNNKSKALLCTRTELSCTPAHSAVILIRTKVNIVYNIQIYIICFMFYKVLIFELLNIYHNIIVSTHNKFLLFHRYFFIQMRQYKRYSG